MFDAFDIMLLALLAVPIMKSLRLAPAQLDLADSIQLMESALGGIVMGTLADYVTSGITQDRRGRRTTLCLFIVGEAVMMVIFLLIVPNSYFMCLMALLLVSLPATGPATDRSSPKTSPPGFEAPPQASPTTWPVPSGSKARS